MDIDTHKIEVKMTMREYNFIIQELINLRFRVENYESSFPSMVDENNRLKEEIEKLKGEIK